MYVKETRMLTSCHVHSTYSDGIATIRDLALAAVALGLDELGISDHYVLLGSGKEISWSMPLSNLPVYFEELREVAAEFRDKLTIGFGLEADFDPASAYNLREVLEAYPFDYVIGAVHFIDGFPVDEKPENWDALSKPERNDMMRAYWDRIVQLANSQLFDFAAHLDLCKKFGHLPTDDLSKDINAALDAIAQSRMAIEINTSGWYKPIKEAYPSPAILTECRTRDIPIIINSDAHDPANLIRGLDRAIILAREAGYTQVATFARRRMAMAPL
jgi:histidinol-phosphatase (PHP family)